MRSGLIISNPPSRDDHMKTKAGCERNAHSPRSDLPTGFPIEMSGKISKQEVPGFTGAGCPFTSDPPTEIISFTLMLGALKAA